MIHSSSNDSFYLISYDISNDKRRNRVAKILVNVGTRVQYSVFEIIVNKLRLEKTLFKLKKVVNLDEDSIRLYHFCPTCMTGIEIIGQGKVTKDEDYYIV